MSTSRIRFLLGQGSGPKSRTWLRGDAVGLRKVCTLASFGRSTHHSAMKGPMENVQSVQYTPTLVAVALLY